MDIPKNLIRCTIDFLPDDNVFDAIVAFRHAEKEGWQGCLQQQFTSLKDACTWVEEEAYPDVVAAWRSRQQPEPAPEKTEAPEKSRRPIIFISPWASPEQVRKSLIKAGTNTRNKKGKGG